MKVPQSLVTGLLLVTLLLGSGSGIAQEKQQKLTKVSYEVPVSISAQEAWQVLRIWGNFADYHAGVNTSAKVGDQATGVGAKRSYTFGKKGKVEEKVTLWVEGQRYEYQMTESQGFPFAAYQAGFGVREDDTGQVFIYHFTNYRASPGFLTGMMKGSLTQGLRKSLLAMKHYAETGEKRKPLKELSKRYAAL